MNCKQGDIAMLINGPNQGAIFRCIRRIGCEAIWGVVWEVESLSQGETADHDRAVDSSLRPLRGDLEPETTDEREPLTA